MAAVGPALAATADSNLVPTLIGIAVALLGGGGLAGILTALATRRNYVQTGFRDLADASAKEAEQERRNAADERAAKERAEYRADRWRAYSWALRDELSAAGVVSKAIPPTDHPSEAS